MSSWGDGSTVQLTYLTRSNTDTRLPTGLNTEFPSGVNSIVPWRYTVPQRFENYHNIIQH